MADPKEAASEQQSKAERAEAVEKAMEGGSSQTPTSNYPTQSEESPGADAVGESTTRRAEDIAKHEKEPGRQDTGPEGGADRPTGTSTARDVTGVDPQDPE